MTSPKLSLITTCKGRLQHLESTLPRMAEQADCECIVVDYDCPDGTGSWVAAHFPDVRLVRVVAEPMFRLAHARNLGASKASADWLVFVDADALLTPSCARELLPLLVPGYYYRPSPRPADAWGFVVCERARFEAIAGYDDVLRGWGGEDEDLYLRLGLAGGKPASFPGALLNTIPHDTAQRVRFSDIGDRWISQRAHALYCYIKFDLLRQTRQLVLPLEVRQAIYEEVRRTVVADAASGAASSRITVQLPLENVMPVWGWTIRREWTFVQEKLPNVPPPAP